MSSYSFSHQFYQHWTCAPEPIRAAIIQELTDITTLLHSDTPFENFVFSVPDLNAHLDELYQTHQDEQAAAKAIADKQEQHRAAAEQQRLEAENKAQEEKAQEEKAQEEKVKAKARQEQQDQNALLKANSNHLINKVNADNKGTDDSHNKTADISNKNNNKSINDKVNATNDSPIKAITNKYSQTTMIDSSLKNAKLSAANETLIRELERHVDDYLSEQMAQMSENLKSWLRAEVTQQLAEPLTEQGQAVESIAKKK